jgi:hypothetical protein
LIGAVLGWPITKALDGWASESKLPWGVYLLGSIIGIAVVLLIMSFFIKRWRQAFWGGIGLGLRWLWSWHPVSARHSEALREMDRLRILVELPTIIRTVISEDKASAEETRKMMQPLVDQMVRKQLQANKAVADTVQAGAAAVLAEPVIPLPDPRWTIERESFNTWLLTNQVPRSVAKEVRVEGTDQNGEYAGITILNAAHFEDLSGRAWGRFDAKFDQDARWNGATFLVSWYDETSVNRWERVFVPGWEKRPDLDTWRNSPGLPL